MCGRFTLRANAAQIAELFGLPPQRVPAVTPRYNIAPTQPLLVVRALAEAPHDLAARARQLDPAALEVTHLQWGLIPPWAKDPGIGSRMINARSETVGEKPAYRHAVRRRRCLVPADGMYEWPESLVQNGKRWPVFVTLEHDEPFALAGIWERWQGPGGEELQTVALMTTEPNELIAPMHDRMAVMVHKQQYGLWLDPAVQDVKELEPILAPYPSEHMVARRVSRKVNNARFEGPECIAELTEAELQAQQQVTAAKGKKKRAKPEEKDDGQRRLFE